MKILLEDHDVRRRRGLQHPLHTLLRCILVFFLKIYFCYSNASFIVSIHSFILYSARKRGMTRGYACCRRNDGVVETHVLTVVLNANGLALSPEYSIRHLLSSCHSCLWSLLFRLKDKTWLDFGNKRQALDFAWSAFEVCERRRSSASDSLFTKKSIMTMMIINSRIMLLLGSRYTRSITRTHTYS